jgi:hypothetical protein
MTSLVEVARQNGGRMDSPDHTAAPGQWSYDCRCLRCRWEQWANEGDNSVCPMPDEPHPDGEFAVWFAEREKWSGRVHPYES